MAYTPQQSRIRHQQSVTRESMKIDVIYQGGKLDQVFVTPDGHGRFWYDTIDEAEEQHGELPIVLVEEMDE